jgi:transcriptional regulator with XRE-family HTH domain
VSISNQGTAVNAEHTLAALGSCVRELRKRRSMTLEDLARLTGVSSSMISLIERGKASPSIGTLLAIASGFGVTIPELFSNPPVQEDLVTRLEDQPIAEQAPGYTRRLLRFDRASQTEFSLLSFEPGAFNHKRPSAHRGIEFGVVLQGELTIQFNGSEQKLSPGDAISFRSTEAHRIVNISSEAVTAVWLNVSLF